MTVAHWPKAATSAGLPTPLPALSVSSSVVQMNAWDRERATHCCLSGFIPGLGVGKGGMLRIVYIASHFLEPFFGPLFPNLHQAHDSCTEDDIRDEGQEGPRHFSADF